MAVEQIGNLLKSKATMWIAAYGEAQPDETDIDAGEAWGGNWTKVGWTKAPLAFRYTADTSDLHIEQALGAVARRKIGESAEFETVLAEATALSIAYAAGMASGDVTETAAGASQKAYEEIEIGNEVILDDYAVGFEGITYDSSGAEQPVRVFFTKANVVINGELAFSQKDDDYTGVPVQVRALADSGNSFKMLKWQRITAPVSA